MSCFFFAEKEEISSEFISSMYAQPLVLYRIVLWMIGPNQRRQKNAFQVGYVFLPKPSTLVLTVICHAVQGASP